MYSRQNVKGAPVARKRMIMLHKLSLRFGLFHNSQSSLGRNINILRKTLSGKGQGTNKKAITMPTT